ncbi:MAG: UDP-N-acetylglucosamine 2-epimerase [Candidatus Poriferisodalaceae bacterium]|jgi:UDP-N-acetylglucosamine 2-epimerase
MKIMTVVGTRPEIIRLSCVIPKVDAHFDQVLVHTGQNYDYELNQVFFDDLGLREPDRYLAVDTSSVGRVYGEVIIKTEEVLIEEQPDALLVLGDTNSAIAAVMARRMAIPIFHMEAGNRCFDWRVPEEMNRRIIDHISNYNLVYTEHARRNLLNEGVHAASIIRTGSPMNEVLAQHRHSIDAATAVEDLGLTQGEYYLVSLHRQENVDDEASCRSLFEALFQLSERDQMPVIVSTHPRTRARLETFGLHETELVRFLKPFGFHDYNKLQLDARVVISDSGTISEEASLLGFPAVSPRTATERPEGVDNGVFVLGQRDTEGMLRAIDIVAAAADNGYVAPVPVDYLVQNTSDIVVRALAAIAPRT